MLLHYLHRLPCHHHHHHHHQQQQQYARSTRGLYARGRGVWPFGINYVQAGVDVTSIGRTCLAASL